MVDQRDRPCRECSRNGSEPPFDQFPEFDTYNENGTGYGYQADTRRPSLDNLSITALKAFDAFDYDNSSLHVLKTGDNLSLTFITDEPVDNTSLVPSSRLGQTIVHHQSN